MRLVAGVLLAVGGYLVGWTHSQLVIDSTVHEPLRRLDEEMLRKAEELRQLQDQIDERRNDKSEPTITTTRVYAMKTYRGERTRTKAIVTVEECGFDGRRDLPLQLELANHSPTGFEWGYGGSGPAQLSLALLADALDETIALNHYQRFKAEVVSNLPHGEWMMTEHDIHAWYWKAAKVDSV